MEMIEVDGLRIAYERAGDGPPLPLHAYVGDGRSCGGPRSRGSPRIHRLAWHAPGAGRSSDPAGPVGIDAYADA